MKCPPCAFAGSADHKCDRFVYAGPYTSRCGCGCDPGPHFADASEE